MKQIIRILWSIIGVGLAAILALIVAAFISPTLYRWLLDRQEALTILFAVIGGIVGLLALFLTLVERLSGNRPAKTEAEILRPIKIEEIHQAVLPHDQAYPYFDRGIVMDEDLRTARVIILKGGMKCGKNAEAEQVVRRLVKMGRVNDAHMYDISGWRREIAADLKSYLHQHLAHPHSLLFLEQIPHPCTPKDIEALDTFVEAAHQHNACIVTTLRGDLLALDEPLRQWIARLDNHGSALVRDCGQNALSRQDAEQLVDWLCATYTVEISPSGRALVVEKADLSYPYHLITMFQKYGDQPGQQVPDAVLITDVQKSLQELWSGIRSALQEKLPAIQWLLAALAEFQAAGLTPEAELIFERAQALARVGPQNRRRGVGRSTLRAAANSMAQYGVTYEGAFRFPESLLPAGPEPEAARRRLAEFLAAFPGLWRRGLRGWGYFYLLYLELANAAFRSECYDEAISYYTRAIKLVPFIVDPYQLRGISYHSAERYDEAIADFTQAIKLAPDRAAYYHWRGISYKNAGRYDEAVVDYTYAIQMTPDNADYYRGRGISNNAAERYEKAIVDFTRAIELAPDSATNHYWRGISYKNAGRYNDAIADFTRAIELVPDSADYFHWRGISFNAAERFDEAIADFTRAIELAPENANYHHWRGISHNDAECYDEAISDFANAIELEPENANYYHWRGISYRNARRYEDAIVDFTRAIELDPKPARYLSWRAITHRDAKHYDRAIADDTRAIDLETDNASYYYSRGVSYHAAERYEEAIADKSRAIELAPDNASYYQSRGLSNQITKRYDEAIADYTRALELAPDNASYYDLRSTSYHMVGRYDEAIADDTRAIELDPDNPKYYESRAISYRGAGRVAEAEADEQRARELRGS